MKLLEQSFCIDWINLLSRVRTNYGEGRREVKRKWSGKTATCPLDSLFRGGKLSAPFGVAIESDFVEFAITLLFAWFVLRFLIRVVRRPSDLAETEPGDFGGNPARLRPQPRYGAGAVAVAEPDEGDGSFAVLEPAKAIPTKDRGRETARVA
jgi:hypothetical protein